MINDCLPSASFQYVYLFQGGDDYDGITPESLSCLETQIQKVLKNASFVRWNAEHTPPKDWDQKGLCVFPGGECGKWNKILTIEMQLQILQWIKNGGRILGVCAGGYFCAERSKYLVSPDQWIEATRIVNVFKGVCQGPFFSANIEIIKVKWGATAEEGYVTVIKGGAFYQDPDSIEEGCVVLATFVDTEAAAVIRCQKGAGTAVLSSIHWEFGAKHIRPLIPLYPGLDKKLCLLKNSKSFRSKCFAEIMQLLS